MGAALSRARFALPSFGMCHGALVVESFQCCPAWVDVIAVFSILRGWWKDAKVVDVFCGVGSIGLEAVSRGAREAFFVEQDRRVASLLQENIEAMDCSEQAEVLRADAFSPLVRLRLGQDCDIISLDPPYAMMQETQTLEKVLEASIVHLTVPSFRCGRSVFVALGNL